MRYMTVDEVVNGRELSALVKEVDELIVRESQTVEPPSKIEATKEEFFKTDELQVLVASNTNEMTHDDDDDKDEEEDYDKYLDQIES